MLCTLEGKNLYESAKKFLYWEKYKTLHCTFTMENIMLVHLNKKKLAVTESPAAPCLPSPVHHQNRGGYSLNFWVRVCHPKLKTLTLSQTYECLKLIPYPRPLVKNHTLPLSKHALKAAYRCIPLACL